MFPCNFMSNAHQEKILCFMFHLVYFDFKILITEKNSVEKMNPWTTYNPTYLHVETIKLITYCAKDQRQLCQSLIASDVLLSIYFF